MLRRTDWLGGRGRAGTDECGGRGWAEEFAGVLAADYVTARAVAASRSLSVVRALVSVGGELVAMRGASAAAELSAARPLLARLGLGNGGVETVGAPVLADPTVLVILPQGVRCHRTRRHEGRGRQGGRPARRRSKTGAAGGHDALRPKRHRRQPPRPPHVEWPVQPRRVASPASWRCPGKAQTITVAGVCRPGGIAGQSSSGPAPDTDRRNRLGSRGNPWCVSSAPALNGRARVSRRGTTHRSPRALRRDRERRPCLRR